MTVYLYNNLFFAGEEDIAINRIYRYNGTWVLILPHLWGSRLHLLLGINQTLVWNRFFQYIRRWLLQTMFWGLLRGRQRWRMLCIHGLFHLFEVDNLGEIVITMSILTIENAREFYPRIVVVLPWLFVFFVPLGVLVSPNRMVLLGVISSSSWVVVVFVSLFSFILGIIQMMGLIFHIQLFKIMKLLNGRGLNKVNADMWFSLWRRKSLWRIRKWKIWIVLGGRSIWCIGS
jgi:hypothetical protein